MEIQEIYRLLDRIDNATADSRRYTEPARALVTDADDRLTDRACAEDSDWNRIGWRCLRLVALSAVMTPLFTSTFKPYQFVGLACEVLALIIADLAWNRARLWWQLRRFRRPATPTPYDSDLSHAWFRARSLGADSAASQRQCALLAAERAALLAQATPLLAEPHRLAAARAPPGPARRRRTARFPQPARRRRTPQRDGRDRPPAATAHPPPHLARMALEGLWAAGRGATRRPGGFSMRRAD
ncbi:hypothetical protein [Fodinicola feengrottensis]|uniref:hypothetical protein n=1 Tax=Fodinicola feengrottensis TaxID=435914 RepID=UPI0024433C39|nr:hypothetical protein [Fodinicola feengrottensis]